MINTIEPPSWQDLQTAVATILTEAGVATEVEKLVCVARGNVSVDIWAHDASATPPQTYIIECKRWRKRIPQSVVHAFRTVVGDAGANWGAIISAAGFQPGAYNAAQYSNVRLLTWAEFEALFEARWLEYHFVSAISDIANQLMDYMGFGSADFYKNLSTLSNDGLAKYKEIREKYSPLADFCFLLRAHRIGSINITFGDGPLRLPLPLKAILHDLPPDPFSGLSDAILQTHGYRELLQQITREVHVAVSDFGSIFGPLV